MKRAFATAVAAVAICAAAAAQDVSCHFGVLLGSTISHYGTFWNEAGEPLQNNGVSSWHAGATLEIKLPAYFSIQPGVQYESQRSKVVDSYGVVSDLRTDNIVVPVAIQWGPDLGIFRPYVQAVPYADITLGASMTGWEDVKESMANAQFGLGAGLGIEIWRFQVSGRYNWNFGSWHDLTSGNPFENVNDKKQTFIISVAFFFN